MLVGILLGIVIWQIVVIVGFAISGQNEDCGLTIGMLIPYLLVNGIMFIYKFISLIIYNKNYTMCTIRTKKRENDNCIMSCIAIKLKDIQKYYSVNDDSDYYIKIYDNFTGFKSCPSEKITNIRKNGWFCQEWVNNNLVK